VEEATNMSITSEEVRLARRVLRHELEAIRGNWGWILALGIIEIVVGMLAIGMPFAGSLATIAALSALLIIGGIAQLVGAFWTRDWSGFFLSLLMGVLYLVTGVVFFRHPADAMAAVTLLLACALMVGGLFRIIGSLMYRFPQWGWTLLGGAINLVLGIYIYSMWPAISFVILGLFVGIDLVFTGCTWIALASAVKNLGRRLAPGGAAPNPAG
jgi:uncharacterized membrane protein HdeD (DUF308 family)